MTTAVARIVRRPLGDAAPIVGGAALVAFCASRFSEVFGGTYQPVGAVVAPLVHAVVALVLPLRRWWARAAVHLATAVVLAGSALVAAGGPLTDLPRALVRGAGSILSGQWPAAASPDAVGLLTFLAAVAGACACELAWHRRAPAALLVPPLAIVLAGAVLAAPAGMPDGTFLGVVAVGATVVMAAAASARSHADRRLVHVARGGRRRGAVLLLPAVAVTVLLTTLALASVAGGADRFDPRQQRHDPTTPTAEISPLSRLDEWRSKSPPQVLFRANAPGVKRWRLVALTRYDGRAWMPPGDFRRAGSTLGDAPPRATTRTVDVRIAALDGRWVPVPAGEPLAVARAVRTDPTRSGVLADDDLADGQVIRVRVAEVVPDAGRLEATPAVREDAASAPGDVDVPAAVRTLATQVVEGAGTDYERAVRLATFLKQQYQRADDSPAGHSLPLLELFLERTKRGRDEQFVAAYGLLARAVGLPVRIAVGFTTDGNDPAVRSDGATAWPEVEFAGVGWVAFDPVPDTTAPPLGSAGAGGTVVAQDQLPTPPTTAPPTSTTAPPPPPAAAPRRVGGGLPTTAVAVGGGGLVVVLAAVGYLVAVTLLKRRRRARLLAAGDEREQVVGAFVAGMDWLTDLGAPTRPQATDRELVGVARRTVGDGGEALAPLADLATASVYAAEVPADDDVAEARAALEAFESSLPALGRRRWWRARLSLRSLRRPFPR